MFSNELVTSRLNLKLLTTADHAFMMELVNTKGWLEFIGDRNVHSEEDAINYINRILITENIFYWVVSLKETGKPLGIISFLKRKYLEHFDIGFAFLPEFNGHGYAFEAASEVLAMVFRNADFHPVLATTFPGNTSSIKLLKKLGFRFERELEVDEKKLLVYTTADL